MINNRISELAMGTNAADQTSPKSKRTETQEFVLLFGDLAMMIPDEDPGITGIFHFATAEQLLTSLAEWTEIHAEQCEDDSVSAEVRLQLDMNNIPKAADLTCRAVGYWWRWSHPDPNDFSDEHLLMLATPIGCSADLQS